MTVLEFYTSLAVWNLGLNSFLARGDFCCSENISNILDPAQDQHSEIIFLKSYFL